MNNSITFDSVYDNPKDWKFHVGRKWHVEVPKSASHSFMLKTGDVITENEHVSLYDGGISIYPKWLMTGNMDVNGVLTGVVICPVAWLILDESYQKEFCPYGLCSGCRKGAPKNGATHYQGSVQHPLLREEPIFIDPYFQNEFGLVELIGRFAEMNNISIAQAMATLARHYTVDIRKLIIIEILNLQ